MESPPLRIELSIAEAKTFSRAAKCLVKYYLKQGRGDISRALLSTHKRLENELRNHFSSIAFCNLKTEYWKKLIEVLEPAIYLDETEATKNLLRKIEQRLNL
jgi:hypothetical protein